MAQSKDSSESANKALVLKMVQLVNAQQAESLGEVIADDFVDHGPSAGGGLAGFRKGVETMHGSFPNLNLAVESLVAEGDKVTLRGTLSGIFSGKPMFGVPATGKAAKWLTIMTYRVANGKLAERWTEADTWGMLQQVGVLPSASWGDMSAMAVKPARAADQEKKNKEIAAKLFDDVWVNRKLDGIGGYFAEGGGLAAGVPAGGGMRMNPALIRMVAESVFKAFPDFAAKMDFAIAEGDSVVMRITETGTQKAEYMGVAATDKKATWSDTFFFEFKDGKVETLWLQSNVMGLMGQLGGFKPQKPAVPAAAAGSAAERNKQAIERFIDEFWNQRKFDIADQIIAPEHFTTSIPTLPKGPEGMKIIAGVVANNIFPDLKRKVLQIFATDDMVGAVWENSGTHKGTYMNVPATGKAVKWVELAIFKMKDGKMVESWYRPDELGLVKEMVPEKLDWLHF
jgi:predicted ester cyclase